MLRETVVCKSCSLLTANKAARQAAAVAKAKGWETWVAYDQCDVLSWATAVARKPGTNWYFIVEIVEDDETLYKVLGREAEVLKKYLGRNDAYPIPE